MELAGGALLILFIGLLVNLLVSSVVVHLAANFAGVSGATFKKAFKACIIAALAEFGLAVAFSIVPLAGTAIGVLIGLAVTLLVFKRVYDTGWGRALVLWFMQWVVVALLFLALAVILGVSLS